MLHEGGDNHAYIGKSMVGLDPFVEEFPKEDFQLVWDFSRPNMHEIFISRTVGVAIHGTWQGFDNMRVCQGGGENSITC